MQYSQDDYVIIQNDLFQAYDKMLHNGGSEDFICFACKYEITKEFIAQHVHDVCCDRASLIAAYMNKAEKDSVHRLSKEWSDIRNKWHMALYTKAVCLSCDKQPEECINNILLFED